MKTYKEFLDEISEFYTVGSEVELSYLEFNENQELYERATAEGYITFGLTHRGTLTMIVIRLPDKLSEEFVIAYFN